MDILSILAGLLPIFTEAGKAAVQRWIAPDTFKPTTITDYVAMREQDIKLFQSLNEAGGTGETYKWVNAITKLMRPFVVLCVLIVWAIAHATSNEFLISNIDAIDRFASAIAFYLFADRTLFYAKKAADK